VARERADDPRYQRVRGRLVQALLELAASRPAESISVSELTAAAGVSRASFYAHASSPAGLLADLLIGELQVELDRFSEQMSHPGADYVNLWRQIYLVLLAQVRRYQAVYTIITAQESSVSSALTAYFEAAARPYIQALTAQLEGPPVSELWVSMALHQQAHNMMAVIRAWIVTGMTDSPDTVVDTYLTLAPPWQLARPNEQGVISLRRVRSMRGALAHEPPPDP
jgi:AcrR family transcriptional regulator